MSKVRYLLEAREDLACIWSYVFRESGSTIRPIVFSIVWMTVLSSWAASRIWGK